MARLNAVAKSKLDKLHSSVNGGDDLPPGPRRGNVDKDLPLAPDEIAGLREQKRQYTRELEAEVHRKPDVDPNHAYPTFEQSTTLFLSEIISENP
jgi:hypothetical protein